MPRDQYGRRIRPHQAERERARAARPALTARKRLYLKAGAGGLALLAVVLAVVAAQSK